MAELLLQRGYEVSHETIRIWEFRFAPMVSEQLRSKRRGQAGRSWYIDETSVASVCNVERAKSTAILQRKLDQLAGDRAAIVVDFIVTLVWKIDNQYLEKARKYGFPVGTIMI